MDESAARSELVAELRKPKVGRVEQIDGEYRVVADTDAIKDLCNRAADALEAAPVSERGAWTLIEQRLPERGALTECLGHFDGIWKITAWRPAERKGA